MAGIGLFNFEIDAKSVEPIAILALAGVAGFFLFRHLNSQNNAAGDTSAIGAAATADSSLFGQLSQLAILQSLTGSAAGSNATGATTSTGTASGNPSIVTTSTGSSLPAGGNTSSEVGTSGGGSV